MNITVLVCCLLAAAWILGLVVLVLVATKTNKKASWISLAALSFTVICDTLIVAVMAVGMFVGGPNKALVCWAIILLVVDILLVLALLEMAQAYQQSQNTERW